MCFCITGWHRRRIYRCGIDTGSVSGSRSSCSGPVYHLPRDWSEPVRVLGASSWRRNVNNTGKCFSRTTYSVVWLTCSFVDSNHDRFRCYDCTILVHSLLLWSDKSPSAKTIKFFVVYQNKTISFFLLFQLPLVLFTYFIIIKLTIN